MPSFEILLNRRCNPRHSKRFSRSGCAWFKRRPDPQICSAPQGNRAGHAFVKSVAVDCQHFTTILERSCIMDENEKPSNNFESYEESTRSIVDRLELVEKFNAAVLALVIFALSAVS